MGPVPLVIGQSVDKRKRLTVCRLDEAAKGIAMSGQRLEYDIDQFEDVALCDGWGNTLHGKTDVLGMVDVMIQIEIISANMDRYREFCSGDFRALWQIYREGRIVGHRIDGQVLVGRDWPIGGPVQQKEYASRQKDGLVVRIRDDVSTRCRQTQLGAASMPVADGKAQLGTLFAGRILKTIEEQAWSGQSAGTDAVQMNGERCRVFGFHTAVYPAERDGSAQLEAEQTFLSASAANVLIVQVHQRQTVFHQRSGLSAHDDRAAKGLVGH